MIYTRVFIIPVIAGFAVTGGGGGTKNKSPSSSSSSELFLDIPPVFEAEPGPILSLVSSITSKFGTLHYVIRLL